MRKALLAAGGLVMFARTAQAEPAWMKVFVSPGVVSSWSFKPDTASGPGFEISAGYFWWDTTLAPHVGGVYRGQGYNTGPWGSFGRHTIALEGGLTFVGMEVGWAFRDDFPLAPGVNGLHLSPYLTAGLIYVGPQFLIPVNGKGDVEIAINLGFKLPLPQSVALPLLALGNWGRMPSGRPFRDGADIRTAPLQTGKKWRRGQKPRVAHLDPYTRASLASHWADEARAEHASVATFAKLVLELLALGAPASLVRRAQKAMADEIRHAEICFGLASAYAGADIDPGPLEMPKRIRKPSRKRLAREAYFDGVIGEGLAAAVARARESDDPVVRKALRTIAKDEARHAALGQAIYDWARVH